MVSENHISPSRLAPQYNLILSPIIYFPPNLLELKGLLTAVLLHLEEVCILVSHHCDDILACKLQKSVQTGDQYRRLLTLDFFIIIITSLFNTSLNTNVLTSSLVDLHIDRRRLTLSRRRLVLSILSMLASTLVHFGNDLDQPRCHIFKGGIEVAMSRSYSSSIIVTTSESLTNWTLESSKICMTSLTVPLHSPSCNGLSDHSSHWYYHHHQRCSRQLKTLTQSLKSFFPWSPIAELIKQKFGNLQTCVAKTLLRGSVFL